mgnify:CR=1 FL=1
MQLALLRERVRELRAELERRDAELAYVRGVAAEQRRAFDSPGWRAVTGWRAARDRLLRYGAARLLLSGAGARSGAADARGAAVLGPGGTYARWIQRTTPSAEALQDMAVRASRLACRPLFSIVTRVEAGDGPALATTVQSIVEQVWTRWELLVAASPVDLAAVRAAFSPSDLEDARVRVEARQRTTPGDAASVAAERAAGDLVVLVRPGDELAATALYDLALAVEASPDADLIYADEDRTVSPGVRGEPHFKPDWSPDLLLARNYVGRFGAYRRALLSAIASDPPSPDVDADHDLVLRATERARRVVHVARVLFHAAPGEPALTSGDGADPQAERRCRAVERALQRRGVAAAVERTRWPVCRVRYALRATPTVSLVIPTRDRGALLRRCIESIDGRSTWDRRELVVIDNGTRHPASLRYLRQVAARHAVVRDPRVFNWSALNNAAAHRSTGDVLLFVNDDVEVIAPEWIEAMLEHAQRPDVGVVGAKLLYPDGTLQHAGVVLGVGQSANHAFRGIPDGAPTYCHLAHTVREVSAVTGACMMLRRDVFERVGGFDERLSVAFNDVDLCLRAQQLGLRVVYSPHAVLLHHESATRRKGHPAREEELLAERWQAVLGRDPYYNPNLSRSDDYALAP